MKRKMEKFPEKNPNPVLCVSKDGTVLYSNEANEPLLHEWGTKIGEKLPSYIADLVRRVISQNNPEKIEVKTVNKVYLVVFSPLPEQECVNISGFDISNHKEVEEKVEESEVQRIADVELAEIIDAKAIQSLMDDFYRLSQIPMSIDDLKGNVLVGVGWQDICTSFHRINPETCKHCVESSTTLSEGILHGEFKLYKCKNNMWHMATPIMVGGQHVGNIISGQFFFDDEPMEHELFKSQAGKYGFNEEDYITAFEKVPRLSRKAVDTGMSFFIKLANLISQLCYSNTRLAQSLVERDTLMEELRKSEERFRSAFDDSAVAMALVCPNARLLKVNEAFCRLLGFEKSEMEGRTFLDFTYPDDVEPSILTHKAVINREKPFFWLEKRYICKDGRVIWCEVSSSPVFDSKGQPIYMVAHIQDITERKRAEEKLRKQAALIDISPDGIITRQLDGTINFWSKGAQLLYGWTSQEVIGQQIHTLLKTRFPQPLEQINEQFQQTGYWSGELFHYTKDGRRVVVQSRWQAEFNNQGNVREMLESNVDITKRKEAEAKLKDTFDNLDNFVKERTEELEKAYNSLKESEERLAEAQKMAHIGNYDNDLVYDKFYWSDELYRIFGLKPQEGMKFKRFLSYIHPSDRNYVENAVIEAYKGKSYAINYRIIRPNGEERLVHSEMGVIFDKKNNPIRAKGTIQDVTEHKKAEEKIERLANIVEYTTDGIGLITPEGIVLEWNKGEERIYGYDVEDIVGRHISLIAPPHLKNEPMDFVELIKKTRTSYSYTTSRLRKDGKTIEVSITLSPVFDGNGKMTAISFITRDITEQKMYEERLRLSEEKYRNIVETANEGISLLDSEGIVTYVNKKLADMLKYSSGEMIGRPAWDFVATECASINKSNIEKRRLGVNESYEIKLIRKDGSSIWVSINARSIFDDDGKYIGSLSMHTDITNRKEAEEALDKIEIARKQEIHHRIKNNLQVISSLLDLQAEQFIDKKCIKYSEVLEAFRESQDRVISMALIHEELYKGGGFDTLNFSLYIKGLAENLLKTYTVGNTAICLNLDLVENTFFDMDNAVPLGMIINELVTNSLKHAFSGRNEGEIQIKLSREANRKCVECINEDCKSTSFTLTVSDNGIGIPEDLDIEDLDSLGLQLVTSLVDQLDGELELKRNNGTEFFIRFTVIEKNNQASAPAPQLIE